MKLNVSFIKGLSPNFIGRTNFFVFHAIPWRHGNFLKFWWRYPKLGAFTKIIRLCARKEKYREQHIAKSLRQNHTDKASASRPTDAAK